MHTRMAVFLKHVFKSHETAAHTERSWSLQLTYYKYTCLGQPPLQIPSGYIIAGKVSEKNFRTTKSWCVTRINIGDICLEVLFYLKYNKIKYCVQHFWLIDTSSRIQEPKADECFVSIFNVQVILKSSSARHLKKLREIKKRLDC